MSLLDYEIQKYSKAALCNYVKLHFEKESKNSKNNIKIAAIRVPGNINEHGRKSI